MHCRVLLFAAARDRAGQGELTVELPAGARASDLLAACVAASPALLPLQLVLRVALDRTIVDGDAPVRDGAEAALLPPVSGG